MGRGRGGSQTTARGVLLGRKGKGLVGRKDLVTKRIDDEIFKTFVDINGNRIVRSFEDREEVVEEITNTADGSTKKRYIYYDDLDYDLLGDSIVIKDVLTDGDQVTTTFYYSDNNTTLIRNVYNRKDPVEIVEEKGEVKEKIFAWEEDAQNYIQELRTKGNTEITKTWIDGRLHSEPGRAAEEQRIGDILTQAKFYYNGSLESIDDKPSVVYYHETDGYVINESWRNKAEEKHRVGGPAVVTYREDGTPKSESWYQNDQNYNPNGESRIVYDVDRNIKRKFFTEIQIVPTSGNDAGIKEIVTRTRADEGPGQIEYYPDGKVKTETWHILSDPEGVLISAMGNEHGKPSRITYDENGDKEKEEYHVDGVLHRLDGPAIIENGRKSFRVEGEEYTEEAFLALPGTY